MTIQRINSKNFKFSELDSAVRILKSGGVIVYPTETCYALGGDFLSEKVAKKVYKIKRRRPSMLLPVIVGSLSMAKMGVHFDKKAVEYAKRFWPGPVTLVLPVNSKMKEKIRLPRHKFLEKYKNLALRISSNKIAQSLVRSFGRPLVSTSANISGQGECYNVAEVLNQLEASQEQPDLILDAGPLPVVKPSAIIKIVDEKVEVLRPGPVKLKYQ